MTTSISSDDVLDLLDAITEIRCRNPELRSGILATLRLAASNGHIQGGRLHSQGQDGPVIIEHGPLPIAPVEEERLIEEAQRTRSVQRWGGISAHPLGKDRRLYGVILMAGANPTVGALLADLFLQWHAVAEFVSLEKSELVDENFHLREEIRAQFSERNLIGVAGAFRRVVELAVRVAPSTATVLICGETGTGKEVIAHLIHEKSARANGPFLTVNCGALTETLLETELFGHVKGAFTGAIADRKGRFEAAQGGTIFLDEIGEISQGMQVRLLRVLQEMEVVRVGDNQARKLDVRVIAATNKDLEAEMRAGRFRQDLFYRINVIHLSLPPLRSRQEDIPLLTEHFLGRHSQRNCKYIRAIAKDVLEIMKGYPWPGNVRELENCVEKMVVLAPEDEITADLLPMSLMAYAGGPEAPAAPVRQETFDVLLDRFLQSEVKAALQQEEEGAELYEKVRRKWERHLFAAILGACQDNKTRAAKILGITRNTLSTRLDLVSEVKREWH